MSIPLLSFKTVLPIAYWGFLFIVHFNLNSSWKVEYETKYFILGCSPGNRSWRPGRVKNRRRKWYFKSMLLHCSSQESSTKVKGPQKTPSRVLFRIVYTGHKRKKFYLLSAFPISYRLPYLVFISSCFWWLILACWLGPMHSIPHPCHCSPSGRRLVSAAFAWRWDCQ